MLSRYRCHTGVLLLVDQSPITCRRDHDCASQAKNSKQAPSARDGREDAEKFNYPRHSKFRKQVMTPIWAIQLR